jgi:CRP/FNR family transcriptional regulator
MFASLPHAEIAPFRIPASTVAARPAPRRSPTFDGQRIAEVLRLVAENMPIQRRLVRAGDAVYQAGQRFTHLCVINTGMYKVVNLSPDGREQIVGLKFRGDWLGLDGIADGVHGCDAVAMDTGEVWAVPCVALLAACVGCPDLLGALHAAMSREIALDRGSLMSVCTLPADARVADFLRNLAEGLERRGLRSDQITLRMTRAEIGNYLGVTLETVSRAISRLARCDLIGFSGKGRRDIVIPDVGALEHFVQGCLAAAVPMH